MERSSILEREYRDAKAPHVIERGGKAQFPVLVRDRCCDLRRLAGNRLALKIRRDLDASVER